MATTITRRPDWYTYASGTFVQSGGSLHSMWADNQDSSYVFFTGSGGEIGVRFQPYTLAVNERCAGVRLGARIASTSSGFDFSLDMWVRSGNGSHGDLGGGLHTGPYNSPTNVSNAWHSMEFSQHNLNDIRGQFRNNSGGVTTSTIYEAYLDLDIRTKPTVAITGPAATSAGSPTTR
jgi:hypothetical protein